MEIADMDTRNEAKADEFFVLQPDARRGGTGQGVIFENRKRLLSPPRLTLRPASGGFPALPELPKLVYHPDQGSSPQDLEGGFSGYWLVSERLKKAMEAVDPGAFLFSETDYRAADGSPGPAFYLCDVVRVLDALDEDESQLTIKRGDEFINGKYYSLSGVVRLAFKLDVLGDAHVFRLPYSGFVFCDRTFKQAIEAAGIASSTKSNGLWFDSVGSLADGRPPDHQLITYRASEEQRGSRQ